MSAPHFLLFSESRRENSQTGVGPSNGRWRFVLEAVDGSSKLEAQDKEPQPVSSERLDLLAVVRGLEALDQPSRVTLVTQSRYVSRGFRNGLQDWRENDFQWERFGQMTPIKNSDLWKRIDCAMDYHQVECRTWRFDPTECDNLAFDPVTDDQPIETNPAAEAKSEKRPSPSWLGNCATAIHSVGKWILNRRESGTSGPHFDIDSDDTKNNLGHFTDSN